MHIKRRKNLLELPLSRIRTISRKKIFSLLNVNFTLFPSKLENHKIKIILLNLLGLFARTKYKCIRNSSSIWKMNPTLGRPQMMTPSTPNYCLDFSTWSTDKLQNFYFSHETSLASSNIFVNGKLTANDSNRNAFLLNLIHHLLSPIRFGSRDLPSPKLLWKRKKTGFACFTQGRWFYSIHFEARPYFLIPSFCM